MRQALISFRRSPLFTVRVCDTFFSRLRGLMFRKRVHSRQGLFFMTQRESIRDLSIHSFFVFFLFDAVWLDKHFRVVDIHIRVTPFTFLLRPRKPAQYLLELPAETARSLSFGQRLRVKFKN